MLLQACLKGKESRNQAATEKKEAPMKKDYARYRKISYQSGIQCKLLAMKISGELMDSEDDQRMLGQFFHVNFCCAAYIFSIKNSKLVLVLKISCLL